MEHIRKEFYATFKILVEYAIKIGDFSKKSLDMNFGLLLEVFRLFAYFVVAVAEVNLLEQTFHS